MTDTRVIVRDATPNDAVRIVTVARASWTDTYRGIFEPAFIEDFLALYRRRGFLVAGGGATPDCQLTLRRELKAVDG